VFWEEDFRGHEIVVYTISGVTDKFVVLTDEEI
jgi:hypothetical protein